MIKTQIQLEDWQYSSLKRAGAGAGRSLSDVIRESVSLFLKTKKKGTPGSLEALEKTSISHIHIFSICRRGHWRSDLRAN
jgi:hypothetical protein